MSKSVTGGKTEVPRRILVMAPSVKLILAKRVDNRTSGWVFKGKKPGEPLTRVNNAHEAVLKKIGAEFVIYESRHAFATRIGEAVGDPIALAAILGNANLKAVMEHCYP
jgi:hypothetical protein